VHIETITLQGFKSFGNRTTLEFTPGITAVVGPNGSGKSNLLDALRWATGGGRARTYRADTKTELIFHGAKGKRSVGYAEVEVELRRQGAKLTVRRTLYRDGKSVLKTNGQLTRLTDLQDQLAGSGLGRGTLAIIGQGEVSNVLLADPTRLLQYVAEAAGIGRYQGRREQASQRLQSAGRHLERLTDLAGERRLHCQRLREEAEQADHHDELSRRALHLSYAAARRRQEALGNELTRLLTEQKQLHGKIQLSREQLAKTRQGHQQAQRNLQEKEADYRQALAETERRQGDLRVAEQHLRGINELLEHLEQQLASNDAALRDAQQEKPPTPPQNDRSTLEKNLQETSEELRQVKQRLRQAQLEAKAAEETLQRLERDQRQQQYQETNYRTRSAELELRARELETQIAALEKPAGDPETLAKRGTELSATLQECRAQEEAGRQALEAAHAHHSVALGEALAGRRTAERLRAAYQARQGYAQGPRNALTSGIPGILGSVADLIHAPEQYQKALLTALGRRQESVVVDSAATAKRVLEHVRRQGGWVTILPLDLLEHAQRMRVPKPSLSKDLREHPGVIALLAEVTNVDTKLTVLRDQLLGGTILLSNLDDALGLAHRHHRRPRLVTVDGNLLEPNGAISGGRRPKQQISGTAAWEVERAERTADDMQVAADSARTVLEHARQTLQKLQATREAAREEQQRAALLLTSCRERLSAYQQRRQLLEEEVKRVNKTLTDLMPPATTDLTNRLEAARWEAKRAHGIVQQAREHQEEAQAHLADAEQALAVFLAQSQAFDEASTRYRHHQERSRQLRQQRHELLVSQQQAKTELLAAQEERDRAQDALPKDLPARKTTYLEAREELERFEEQLHLTGEEQARLGQALEGLQLTIARREAARELADAELETFPEGVAVLEISERAARRELREVQAALENMGAVNHRALREYREQAASLATLEEEITKGTLDVKELEATLAELELETTTRLQTAIERLTNSLRTYVNQLFGAGALSAVEVGSREGVPTGLKLRLQPPGKQTRSLQLLSVGERTMGALAFLFALMDDGEGGLPIAVLDEVDAPLDEANIRRYCRFLTRLAERGTQFILITHQKATFEVADTLWGVTTEEGVSRVFGIRKADYATPFH